jgi:hypothetical protein
MPRQWNVSNADRKEGNRWFSIANPHVNPNLSAMGVIGTTCLVHIAKEFTEDAIHQRLKALEPRRCLIGIQGHSFDFHWLTNDRLNGFHIPNGMA